MSSNPENNLMEKATISLKIAKFINWPNEAAKTAFSLMVLGNRSAFNTVAQTLNGKELNGKPIQIGFADSPKSVLPTDILIVPEGEKIPVDDANTINKSPILTISFAPDPTFASIITFKANETWFELNLIAARRAGIEAGYQLIQVANQVVK